MPPLYARVWQYLMFSANFEERKVPMRDGSFIMVGPGQHLTSVRTIANAVGWYERGIWKETNPPTISDIRESAVEIACSEDGELDAGGAWGEVMKCIRNYGIYNPEGAMSNMNRRTA
jgi:hypothetical protein